MKELIKIQEKLDVPKAQTNSFGNYKYRSCEDILEALKPILSEAKCYLVLVDRIVSVGGRNYVRATAKLVNDEGVEVEGIAYAREPEIQKGMNASQITGSASSYARKYALNGLFAIDDTKDPDTMDNREEGINKKKIEKTKEVLKPNKTAIKCENCKTHISQKVADYSIQKFGKNLCYDCQKNE